jgi:hypothetical protein
MLRCLLAPSGHSSANASATLGGEAFYQESCGMWTIWYGPEVKNVVKTKTHSTASSFELERAVCFDLMPTISVFYGIVIQMFWRDHAAPHFHALYAEHEALIELRDFRVIRGSLPERATALAPSGKSPPAVP